MSDDKRLWPVYWVFASFFMGIFTLEVSFFFLVLYNLVTVTRQRKWGETPSFLAAHLPWLLLMGCMLLSSLWAVASSDGAFDFPWALVALVLLSGEQIRRLDWNLVHRVLVIASLPGLFFSVYHLLQVDEILWAQKVGYEMYPRASGFLSNPITHAEGLVVLFGWSLARLAGKLDRRERWLIVSQAVLAFLIILFSRVRAGLLGFTLLLLLHAWYSPRHRKTVAVVGGLGLLGLVPILSVFGFNIASLQGRRHLIHHGWQLFLQKPVLGIGPDRFSDYPDPITGLAAHPHNTMLGVLAESGLVGFLAFAACMIWIGIHLWRVVRQWDEDGPWPWLPRALVSSFLVFWAMGLFDFNFGDTELLLLHGMFWGIVIRCLPVTARVPAVAAVVGQGSSTSGTIEASGP